jgi:creatinine amidohydrolase
MELASMSWKRAEEVFKDIDIAILPVGSVENHGTHGPLGTDFLVPDKLAKMVAEKTKVLVLPTMPYGVCPHHRKFKGTINIGHGGNDPALDTVALELYNKGGIAATIDWWVLAGQINPKWVGGHAGGQEASAMLAIKPEWVDLNEALPLKYNNLTEKLTCLNINTVSFKGANIKIMRDVKDVVESGWFGKDDPKLATKEEGELILRATVDYLVDFIEEFKRVDLNR